MVKQISSLVCPSCGAPLKVLNTETRVVCQYCHATIAIPEDDKPAITIQPPTNIDYRYRPNPLRQFLWIGLLVGVLFISGIIAFGFIASSKTSLPVIAGAKIYSLLNPIILSGQGLPNENQLLAISYNSDESHRLTMLDFSKTIPLQWQSEDLEVQPYLINFRVTGENVLVAAKTGLTLYRQKDGVKLWETSLSDQLPVNCSECLQATADKVFVLTQLGILHAFDLESGKQLWRVTFSDFNAAIYVFQGNPLVVNSESNVVKISLFDGNTGTLKDEISPICPNHVFEDNDQLFELYSTIIPDLQQNNFYLLYGFWEPGCVEKWSADGMNRDWQEFISEELVRSKPRYLFGDEQIFISEQSGNQVWKVALQNGKADLFFQDENYSLTPLLIQDQTLVLEAKRNKGSTRYELWGIDANNGKRIWQIIPQAVEPMSANVSSIIDTDGVYDVHGIPGKLILMQAYDDPPKITFDSININSGVMSDQKTYFVSPQTIFSLDLIGWQDGAVWLGLDDILVIDSNSAEKKIQWP